MPRFYLHTSLPEFTAPDLEGLDAPDLDAARNDAVGAIRGLLAAELATGVLDLRGGIEICDEMGQCLTTIRFGEAVDIVEPRVPASFACEPPITSMI